MRKLESSNNTTRTLSRKKILRLACALPAIISFMAYNAPAQTPETAQLNANLRERAAQVDAAIERQPDEGRHFVFAHYMTCFFNSVEFYKQEIEMAQRYGIEGFALNCGAWTGSNYVPAAERIYEAARQLDTDFKLFFSADAATLRNLDQNIPDMVERFYEHPNQFRCGEKRVLSTWYGRPDTYRHIIDDMKADGYDVCFVPMIRTHNYKMRYSYETILEFFLGNPHMDGIFYFGVDDSVKGIIHCNAISRRVTQNLGKIYMAGVGPAYNSANLRDFQGYRGYGAIWEGIIRDRADWVEVFTWNDYNEDSNLMPWRWQRDWEKHYYNRDESFLDVTGYYTRWFKSRRRPEITQDRVYYAYRNRSHWLRREWNPVREEWEDLTMRGYERHPGRMAAAPDQIHDDVQDKIYATTFLTEPAELTIEIDGETYTFQQPAGVAHVDVPLAGGIPQFTLQRDGDELVSFAGRKQIIDEETQTKENSWASYHLANRLWTGGAAVGPVVARLDAAEGELLGDAQLVEVAGISGVKNQQTDESGVRIPVDGLETATYNLRVTYSNPTDAEARLTLYADGPPRGENDYPYYIPLFLPPTGEDELATVSFLWSLYDTTSYLMPAWRENTEYYPHPLVSDHGAPIITSIELVGVEQIETPASQPALFPELVSIPGGSFTMGSNDGAPDEQPEHEVTISPFAIGKYEVTNEEYERFDPDHRQHRDGYSWRDREPVIYVRWTDPVRYCNWLSEQAGLEPSYEIDGNNVTFNPDGEGFRLPTEAEWEYVASGRGEGHRYPWGDDEPVPGKHGNFPAVNPLEINPNIPSTPGGGTMVVGSYPAGASRDGVMDMAGNVCEWVNDWFQPYTGESKTDPHVWDAPSRYRSIRGSSFGYYGKPLHVSDREFQNPNYGGYIYIGFRVVLPENGMRKLLE